VPKCPTLESASEYWNNQKFCFCFCSSSLFTNSNWFAFEDGRAANDHSAGSLASPSPISDEADEVIVGENEQLVDTATSLKFHESSDPVTNSEESGSLVLENGLIQESNGGAGTSSSSEETEKAPEWVEWRETSDSGDLPNEKLTSDVPDSGFEAEVENGVSDVGKCEPPEPTDTAAEASSESGNRGQSTSSSETTDPTSSSPDSQPSTSVAAVGDDDHGKKAVEDDSK